MTSLPGGLKPAFGSRTPASAAAPGGGGGGGVVTVAAAAAGVTTRSELTLAQAWA